MKTNQFLMLGIAASFAIALTSCGGGDAEETGDPGGAKSVPQKKAMIPVEATEPAKQAALARVETMKQLTAVLKPLREPAAALGKEEELKALFIEYNRLTEVAKAEGVGGRQLARLTAQLAPADWADTRAEFQQYMLLVRQLGQPPRDMMDRLMKVGSPDSAQTIRGVEEHLREISNAADSATPPGKRPRPVAPAE